MLKKAVILLVFCSTILLAKSLPCQQNDQYFPSIAIDGSGNFVITWVDMREDSLGDIYAQRYNNKNELMGSNFKVNDDKGIARQTAPAIFMDNDGNFVITWEDNRNGHSDIYAKKYLFDGMSITTDFKVNDDEGWIYQKSPVITGDETGNFVIAWRDDRDNGYVIYAQRYSFDAAPSGNNIKVRDMGRHDCPPSIASDRSGNFVITWSGKRGSGYEVLAQRFLSNGNPRGQNFLVHGDERNDSHPSVTCDADGDFVIVWQDMRNTPWYDRANGKSDIYAQQYSRNGGSIEDNFKINDKSGNASQLRPSITSDEIGNFIIAWEDKSDFSGNLYVQRYRGDGTPQGTNSIIYNDNNGGFYPSIASDKAGNFVVTWQVSNGEEHDIYARSYYSNGQPAGSRFKVNDDFNKKNPSPETFTLNLFQNYPNPFNSETTISYMLANSCKVRLKIHNSLGQHIAMLVNERQPAGFYQLIWDGKDVNGLSVSSGVYFYTLVINQSESLTNKMLFIK